MSGNPFQRFAFGAAASSTDSRKDETASHLKRRKRIDDDAETLPVKQESIGSWSAVGDRAFKREESVHADDHFAARATGDEVPVTFGDRDQGGMVADGRATTSCKPDKRSVSAETLEAEEQRGADRRLVLLKRLFQAREATTTPIDEFGTHACVAPHATSDLNKRFHILVAALLSSQTRDQVTYAAMQRMHQRLESPRRDDEGCDPEGLTVGKVRAASEEDLDALINPVGFHRRKAQQIKQIAETLQSQYRGDIPKTYDTLVKLPGVGPKIARVILLVAWNEVDGLIVDTHVHRLADRLGWTSPGVPVSLSQRSKVKSKAESMKSPEDTRKALEDWIPEQYWGQFSRMVVGFGQTVCTAVTPKCASCPLADLCPSAFRTTSVRRNTKANKNR